MNNSQKGYQESSKQYEKQIQNYKVFFPCDARVICTVCNHLQYKSDNCTACGKSFKLGVPDKKTPSYKHCNMKDSHD